MSIIRLKYLDGDAVTGAETSRFVGECVFRSYHDAILRFRSHAMVFNQKMEGDPSIVGRVIELCEDWEPVDNDACKHIVSVKFDCYKDVAHQFFQNMRKIYPDLAEKDFPCEEVEIMVCFDWENWFSLE